MVFSILSGVCLRVCLSLIWKSVAISYRSCTETFRLKELQLFIFVTALTDIMAGVGGSCQATVVITVAYAFGLF